MKVELDKEFAISLAQYLATRPFSEVFQAIPVLTAAIEAAEDEAGAVTDQPEA